jgi:hypothetical protein
MFRVLKRWCKNIHWLFNHPPTNMTISRSVLICDYCGRDNSCSNFNGIFTICFYCMHEVCDKVLKGDKK